MEASHRHPVKSRFPRALVLATAIHAVFLGFVAFFAPAVPLAPSPLAQHGEFFDLAWVDVSDPPADPAMVSEREVRHRDPHRVPSDPSRTRGPSTRSKVTVDGPTSESLGLGIVLDPSGSDPDGMPHGSATPGTGAEPKAGSGDAQGRRVDLGIDRGMTWLWTQPERPAPKPRPASTTGGLREALDAHDRKVGLGFGGPVVSAFHSVAASPSAPQRGRARFEAVIDGSGRVVAVHVLSVEGDMDSWRKVAAQVLAALRSRVLRVPPEGVAIVLEVRSRYQLPSGAEPGKAVKLRGAGAEFDLSDIGAVPSHNVAVRVLSERRL